MGKLDDKAYWGGQWKNGTGGVFSVYNPANGKKLCDVADCTAEDTNAAIASAKGAFESWSKKTPKERGLFLLKIRDLLLERKEEFATVLTKENGKPKAEAAGEVVFTASFFEWYAEEAKRQYGETIPTNVPSKRYVTIRQPVGVAALITPWNFPIAMLGRKVAAALAAGCTCVLKPAEDTPLTSLLFARICVDVGVPKGVVNIIPCSRERVGEVGEALCSHEDVKVLSFTGSTEVGELLYSQCGKTVKKISLELGGNAPFVVFPSADLHLALGGLMASKFRNSGQTCVTANRIFVHESLHDNFVARFSEAIDQLKVGDGFDAGVNQGPIINQKQYDRLLSLVNSAIAEGAEVVKGGKELGGLFYSPTIITGVTQNMTLFKEEIFGPVASIIKFQSEEEVVDMMNDCNRGLAGYFYSNDVSQCWRVAEKMEVGMVGVNESLVSTCEIPFGGVKSSGFGKEGSKYGLDEYSHLKFICFGGM